MGSNLSQNFQLAQKVNYRSAKPQCLGNNALVFTGNEILALARFCFNQGAQQPVLIKVCERGKGDGPHTYEGFSIDSLCLTEKEASINFYDPSDVSVRFSLKFIPGQESDPSGTVISSIEALPEYFPFKAYEAFREKLLTEQKPSVRRMPRPR